MVQQIETPHGVVVTVQLSSWVQLFVTSWTVAHQASLSFTISRSLPKFMSKNKHQHLRNQWTKMDGNGEIYFRWPLHLLLWARIPEKKWNSPHNQQKNPKCSTWAQPQKWPHVVSSPVFWGIYNQIYFLCSLWTELIKFRPTSLIWDLSHLVWICNA